MPGYVYGSGKFAAQSVVLSNSWGLQPGTATIVYVGSAPLVAGQSIEINLGGHTFYGLCETNIGSLASSGDTKTLTFKDNREFLMWDDAFCEFNQTEDRFVGNTPYRRYRHIYPGDFLANISTYSTNPLFASQIIAALLAAPTTESPWLIYHCDPTTGAKTAGYHPVLTSNVVYNINCYSGKKLGQVLVEICDQLGLVFSVWDGPYDLVFARKGQGVLPPTPALSDDRKMGTTLSAVPTRVRVLGDRNLYQVHNIAMVPDWAPGFEAYFGDPLKLRDFVFENLSLHATVGGIPAGTRYNAVPGDVEYAIGKQLAYARALEMTVSEFGDAQASSASFRDYRLFGGKPRMQMPAALYIANVLFRAFRLPGNFSFTNVYGRTVTIDGVEMVPDMIAAVTHNPATGAMSWDRNKSADGSGYAIAQGYQVGADGFRTIRPDQFDITKFTSAQDVWQYVPFQIDDSGEPSGRFIVFEQPVIRSSNLFTIGDDATEIGEFNGFAGLRASPTFTFPPVLAALCFRAERFIRTVGTGTRDDVISIPALYEETLIGAGVETNTYTDGKTAFTKAGEVGSQHLSRQFAYTHGGRKRFLQPDVNGNYSSPTQLSGVIDRVTVSLTANGFDETVDFTGERRPATFINDRDFERRERDRGVFPGQGELREQANQLRLQAVALHRDPQTLKSLAEALHGAVVEIRIATPSSGNVKLGTPVWKKPSVLESSRYKFTEGSATSNTAEYNIFAGVTVEHNVTGGKVAKVKNQGVVPIRVKGPIAVNDVVGKAGTDTNATSLVGNGSVPVGQALQAITTTDIKVIEVRIGTAGGGSSVWL